MGVKWLDSNVTHTIDKSVVRVPEWAIKTGFSCDEERVRFTDSLKQGVTPLHIAEREEERGVFDVVDGVHRFEVISAMSDVKKLVVINHGVCSLIKRKALAVRYAWNFTKDAYAFGSVLRELNDTMPDFANWAPVDSDEVNRMIAELHTDLDVFADSLDRMQPEKEKKPRKADTVRETKKVRVISCPGCGEEFVI